MKYPLQFELSIKNALESGITIKNIIEKYKCTPVYINKVSKIYGLQRLKNVINESLEFLSATPRVELVNHKNRKEYYHRVKCECGKEYNISSSTAVRLFKIEKKYQCKECSESFNIRCPRASKQKKRKNNTTGYIGVRVRKDHRDNSIWGYEGIIVYGGHTVFRNRYKDDTLNEKTLIQAVVDRDCFIIDNSLPHTRNLNDKELIAYMKYLGYVEVDTIKNKLEKRINELLR